MPGSSAPIVTRPGCSVITQPVGSQTRPTITTSALQALRRLQLGLDDVKDPNRLVSWLQRFQEEVARALRPLSQSPFSASHNIVRGTVFTAGQTINVQHRLGRPYQGWVCVRAQTNAASLVEAAFPVGVTAAQVLPITSANAGTYDLLVF